MSACKSCGHVPTFGEGVDLKAFGAALSKALGKDGKVVGIQAAPAPRVKPDPPRAEAPFLYISIQDADSTVHTEAVRASETPEGAVARLSAKEVEAPAEA